MRFINDDYTVAWVCALAVEMAAAKAMLDEVHASLPQPKTDHNVYTLGAIGNHNVVVVCLPSGVYGTTSASTTVSHMKSTFQNIRFGLIVGIGGGAPRNLADIRLGDVVVSKPTPTSPGVVQYDLGKTLHEGKLQRTGSLNKPPQVLLKAVSHMESDYLAGKRRISDIMSHALQKYTGDMKLFTRPKSDWLFKPTYKHVDKKYDCLSCDLRQLVSRSERTTDEPYIHYGLIASGNQVIKDAMTRDSIAQELDALCFEMEAAGIMDELPSLIIRGISDYCDSHKHKNWQGYAAFVSAAYAKSLLSTVSAVSISRQLEKTEFTAEESICLQSLLLTDPAEDKNILRRRKGGRADGTCEWILETDELIHWAKPTETENSERSDVLWLYGHPGTGKSTMAMAITDDLPNQAWFAKSKKALTYFFCDSSSEKQRTAISILRGLLYHLVKECPVLMKHLLPKYVERKENLYSSFDALWNVLMEMGRDSSFEIYCIIDALDECESDSQQILLRQFHQSFRRHRTMDSSSSRPHILITSRPYPEIGEYLSQFRNKDLASYGAVTGDLKVMIQEKVKELAKRKQYPESVTTEVSRILKVKAEGTFLWVGIACSELSRPEAQSRNAIKMLKEMPPGLYALYRQLLDTALRNMDDNDDDRKTMVNIMRFVAFARQPLTVSELTALCQLYPDNDEASRLQFTKEVINLCRSMIVIQDQHVRLLHKSVKDFLVKEELDIDELRAHADIARHSINHILDSIGDFRHENITFLNYAVEYWPEHAGYAGINFVISPNQESFFEPESIVWKKWLARYKSMQSIWYRGRYRALERELDEELPKGFSTLHAAARWAIIPLIIWELESGVNGTKVSNSDRRTYNDAAFQTESGLTPMIVAARQGSTKVMDILLSKMQVGLEVSKPVIRAAATNWESGRDIMELLLNQQGDQIHISEDIITAVVGNEKSGKQIINLLLDQQGNQIHITMDVVRAAAWNRESGDDIMALLLEKQDDRVQLSNIISTTIIAHFNTSVVMLLINQQAEWIQISEDILVAAAGNEKSGKQIMEFFLNRQGSQIHITEDVVRAAAWNRESGDDIMALLLEKQDDRVQLSNIISTTIIAHFNTSVVVLLITQQADWIQISEDVLVAAAGNKKSGKQIIDLLLDRQSSRFQITEDVISAAAENRNSGNDIMALLLNQQESHVQLNNRVVATIIQYFNASVVALLIDKHRDKIQTTQDVLVAAVRNVMSGEEVMFVILDRMGDHLLITKAVVRAAGRRKDIVTALLGWRGGQIQITENAVSTIVQENDESMTTLLLAWRGSQAQLVEEVIQAAARNYKKEREVVIYLLNRLERQKHTLTRHILSVIRTFHQVSVMKLLREKGDKVQITEVFLQAAVENQYFGRWITKILLDQQKNQYQITEELLSAAAGNTKFGKDIMALLLQYQGDDFYVTENVLKAAAENIGSGMEVIRLLLDQQGDHTQVTEKVLKAAAGNTGNGIGIIKLLLDRQRDQAQVTEEVLKVAAGNTGNGIGIIKFLLDQKGDHTQVTEKVLKAAAGNTRNGIGIIKLLLDRQRDQAQITEGVLEAAAENELSGHPIIELLLSRQREITITENVITAAAGNRGNGKEILKFLSEKQGEPIQVTHEVIKAAAGNEGSGIDILPFLFERQQDDIQIADDVFFTAASAGNENVLALLSSKTGRSTPSDLLSIALFYNAAKSGNIVVVQQLLFQRTPPDTRNIRGVTPLWIAASNGHQEVVRILLQTRRVNVNNLSIAARPPIFWAAAKGHNGIVRLLLQAHANPRIIDVKGDSPYLMAQKYGHWDTAEILKEYLDTDFSQGEAYDRTIWHFLLTYFLFLIVVPVLALIIAQSRIDLA